MTELVDLAFHNSSQALSLQLLKQIVLSSFSKCVIVDEECCQEHRSKTFRLCFIAQISYFKFHMEALLSPHLQRFDLSLLNSQNNVVKIQSKNLRIYLTTLLLNKKINQSFQDSSANWNINPETGQIKLSFSISMLSKNILINFQANDRIMMNSIKQTIQCDKNFIISLQRIDSNDFNFQHSIYNKKLLTINFIKQSVHEMKRETKQIKSESVFYQPYIFQSKIQEQQILHNTKKIEGKQKSSRKDMLHFLNDIYTFTIKGQKKSIPFSLLSQKTNEYIKVESVELIKVIQNSLTRKLRCFKNCQKLIFSSKNSQLILQRQLFNPHTLSKTFKIHDTQFGSLKLQIIKKDPQHIIKLFQFLRELPINSKQYLFFEQYFTIDVKQSQNHIIKNALNQQQLIAFLENNKSSMSIFTKLKLYTQIIGSVLLLWKNLDIMTVDIGLDTFSVTKNLMIKHSKVQAIMNYKKIGKQDQMQNYQKVQIKLKQNNMNLARLFFQLFFEKQIFYFKPTNRRGEKRLKKIGDYKLHQKIIIEGLLRDSQHYGQNMNQLTLLIWQNLQLLDNSNPLNNSRQNLFPSHSLIWPVAISAKILQAIQN